MAIRLRARALESRWIGYAFALALTAGVTGAIAVVRHFGHVANVSMLYLLAVLASAVGFGSRAAILASIAAFLAYDVFFIEPRYRLTVSDPGEWVALCLLLVTGIITAQLAAGLRERARDAERREREAAVLYDVVRLMADPDVHNALNAVAERLRRELGLAAVLIELGEQAREVRAAAGDAEALDLARSASAPARVMREGEAPTGVQRGSPGRWVKVVPPRSGRLRSKGRDRLHRVPVSAESGPMGSFTLVAAEGAPSLRAADDRLLSAVANQLRLALERARLRDEATEAEVLRRTDELKSALLAAVSHDLRTPLSSIIASAGSLLQVDVDWTEEERREFAAAIEEEAHRLNRLVGNLLDLSRIEAGNLQPEKGWYDLRALVDDVLGRLRPQTAHHKVGVVVADDLPPVLLDYVEIDEVLSNLIENAAKYTPAGTEVRVSARRIGNQLEVEVADRGPGIPAEALAHLFEPFYRVRRPGPQPRGTGLGLAVASGLVEAHGGRIWAENRTAGGARFTFTLPLSEPPVPVATAEER